MVEGKTGYIIDDDAIKRMFTILVSNCREVFATKNSVPDIASIREELMSYTDEQILDLINGAPEGMDTFREVADKFDSTDEAISALQELIATKLDATVFNEHAANTNNPHSVTAAQIGLGKVENKSSAIIRGEITADNITSALGYTPLESIDNATSLSAGLMSASDKSKLDGIAAGAEVNQNAFSTVSVNDVSISADSKTDTLTMVAGTNITLTPDATNDKITISSKDTTYDDATVTKSGLMSASDKTKLDTVEENANNYVHPAYSSKDTGLYKIAVDGTGHVSGTTAVAKADITALGIPAQDTTYSEATTSNAGLMSASDKSKLDGIATGAEVNQNAFTNITVGSTTVSADSKTDTLTLAAGTNVTITPDATNDKITISSKDTTYSEATTSAAGLMSAADKSKLDGIAAGANAYTHPTYTAKSSGLYKISVDGTGHVSGTTAVAKADITALGIPAQDTRYSAMTGATSSAAGTTGLVPAPAAGKNTSFLRGDGTWVVPTNTTYSAATTSTAGLMSASDKSKLDGIAAGAKPGTITGVSVNGASIATSGVANITSVPASILTGAIPSGVTATTQSASDNSTKIATTAYVTNAINALADPMIFMGTVGTDGTITTLPTASAANKGYTYKVITTGTYADQSAKIGDTFISDGSTWVLIPSGDEPSGTVTSLTIKATSPIAVDSTSAITTSGTRTISHANSGVTAATYGTNSGTALTPKFGDTFSVDGFTVNATGHITSAATHTVKIPNTVFGASGTGAAVGLVPAPSTTAGTTKYLREDGTWQVPPDTNTTYSAATTSAPGLMSASDKSKLDGITASADSVSFSRSLTSGTKVGTITINGTGTDLYAPTNTDTHYTSKNVVGATNATSNTTSALTNGNVYLNSVENGAVTSTHKISGSGATTVTTDANGNIVISSTDTNTNTTYSAGTGLALSGTKFNHSNSITAGTAQGDANKTLSFGGTFTIPTITYDAQGHITGKGTTTMTMPANPNVDTKVTQTVTTTAANYPVLLAPSGQTGTTTTSAYFGTGLNFNPNTNTLSTTTFSGALSGTASSAAALTTSAGSATQPVYFSSGKPVACTYTLGKSVPSNAVFTDTRYSAMTGATSSAAGTTGLVPAPAAGKNTSFLRGDGTWVVPTNTTYSAATQSANGLLTAADKKILDSTCKFATCGTTRATAAKVVTLSNFVLQAGSHLFVKFTATDTTNPSSGNITLNVNGTGAKNVYVSQAYSSFWQTTYSHGAFFYNNQVHEFVYDGTQWVMFIGRDNNTTYSNASLGQGYGTCATAAATAAKVVSLTSYTLVTGGIVAVKFTYNVPASATMNINSKGAKAIYFKGAAITAGVINAGDTATFIYNGTQYHLLSVDRSSDYIAMTTSEIQSIVTAAFA